MRTFRRSSGSVFSSIESITAGPFWGAKASALLIQAGKPDASKSRLRPSEPGGTAGNNAVSLESCGPGTSELRYFCNSRKTGERELLKLSAGAEPHFPKRSLNESEAPGAVGGATLAGEEPQFPKRSLTTLLGSGEPSPGVVEADCPPGSGYTRTQRRCTGWERPPRERNHRPGTLVAACFAGIVLTCLRSCLRRNCHINLLQEFQQQEEVDHANEVGVIL
jgi:hypothetical protein